MILFEFEFVNVQTGLRRAWGADVYDALSSLGYNDPVKALAGVVLSYKKLAEVQP